MVRRIVLSILVSIALVSVIILTPVLQTSINASASSVEENPLPFETHLQSLSEKLPESVRSHLNQLASRRSGLAAKSPDISSQVVGLQEDEEWSNITVRRQEYILFFIDKNFASIKVNWELSEEASYTLDSIYVISYVVTVAEGTDPTFVTLADTWKKGIIWGEEENIGKPYYLLGWDTNIPDAGPFNYTSSTGIFSLTFDPDPATEYWIEFVFLAKAGFVNQFITKPKVTQTFSPVPKSSPVPGTFYDLWLKMSGFKVKGLPSEVYVWMEVPNWQSTANGVYIKNMNPQTLLSEYYGADPPQLEPVSAGAE